MATCTRGAPTAPDQNNSHAPQRGPHFHAASVASYPLKSDSDFAPVSAVATGADGAPAGATASGTTGGDSRDRTRHSSAELPVFRDCSTHSRRLRLDNANRFQPRRERQPAEELATPMSDRGFSDRLTTLLATARRVLNETESDAVLVFADSPLDWQAVREELGNCKIGRASCRERVYVLV